MTSLAELPSYTLMQLPPDLTGEPPNEAALKAEFEKGDTKTKIAALKKVLYFILNGEKFPGLLMTIIRFVLPSQVGFLKIVIYHPNALIIRSANLPALLFLTDS